MKYEHWRMIHRLMLVPYLIALYHALFISSYNLVSFTPLGLWTMGVGLVGTTSSLYMILLYRKTAFKFEGTVKNIVKPSSGVTEIELETKKPYDFKDGQFTFIRIDKPPFNGVPHPFSISGSKEGHLYFSIKALGDYTKALGENLETGDVVKLTRPYGHMTFETYASPQVWIAGGIGITPFLSHLRSRQPLNEHVTLYYSVRTIEEAVHLEYLRKLDKTLENFTLEFSESDKDGFLSVESMNLEGDPHVFMCGPIPMAKALKRQFRHTDAHQALTVEAFSFTGTLAEDVMNHSKKLYKKIRMRFSN
jgi:predicted ferric reductase